MNGLFCGKNARSLADLFSRFAVDFSLLSLNNYSSLPADIQLFKRFKKGKHGGVAPTAVRYLGTCPPGKMPADAPTAGIVFM